MKYKIGDIIIWKCTIKTNIGIYISYYPDYKIEKIIKDKYPLVCSCKFEKNTVSFKESEVIIQNDLTKALYL